MTKLALPLLLIGIIVIAIAGGVLIGRQDKSSKNTAVSAGSTSIRYLPLGDSYTIGQSVGEDERWPNQLAARLNNDNIPIFIVDNPSVTGYTTQDLIDKELPLVAKLKPDFVTVLIGVNDYVQGVPIETFQKNLTYILDTLQQQLKAPKNIVLVTIPDYGKTPAGARYGAPVESETGIKNLNAFITQQAAQRGLPLADIFTVSQQVLQDPGLTAGDGLHPSGKQYTAWTEIIYPLSKSMLAPDKQ